MPFNKRLNKQSAGLLPDGYGVCSPIGVCYEVLLDKSEEPSLEDPRYYTRSTVVSIDNNNYELFRNRVRTNSQAMSVNYMVPTDKSPDVYWTLTGNKSGTTKLYDKAVRSNMMKEATIINKKSSKLHSNNTNNRNLKFAEPTTIKEADSSKDLNEIIYNKIRESRIKSLKESKEDIQRLINYAGEELANEFLDIKSRIKPPQNDIYYWLKRPLEEFEEFMEESRSAISNSQKRSSGKSGAKLIYSDSDWKVYHITTYEASVYYGKGTKWCISGIEKGKEYFDDYHSNGIEFYFYINRSGEKYALSYNPTTDYFEVYNAEDNPVEDIPNAPIIEGLPVFIPNMKVINGVLIEYSKLSSDINVTIPNSVTSIGDYAFDGCKSLKSINIPNSVTSIGEGAFDGCKSLKSINIPNSVTSIGICAFENCDSLTSITIPNSVTRIGICAFENCGSLTSITIPNSVTSIGAFTFRECKSFKSITIPNSVTRIGKGAFYECASLKSIDIPNSVTSIGKYAFCNCDSLTSINIPNSVTSIGEGAFNRCVSLTDLKFEGDPKDIEIGKDVFLGTPLEGVY